MNKKCFLPVILVFLLGSFTFAETGKFKQGSEPEGFRGIKWGQNLYDLPAGQGWHQVFAGSGLKGYQRTKEDLELWGSKLERIVYNFLKDNFVHVEIRPSDKENYEILKQALFENFGKGIQDSHGTYRWEGEKTAISLTDWDTFPLKGILYMASQEERRIRKGGVRQETVVGECSSNLKIIGLALHLFAQDNNGEFPERLGELYPKYITSLSTFICSATTSQPTESDIKENFNLCYEYVPGLNINSPYECIIVFDKAASHKVGAKEGRFVLFVRGNLKWIPEKEWQEVYRKHQELIEGKI